MDGWLGEWMDGWTDGWCPYPGQDEIHLQLGHPSAQARPDSEPERHRPKRVLLGLFLRAAEPPLRLEDVRVGEYPLVVGHAVVAQVEQRLKETTPRVLNQR